MTSRSLLELLHPAGTIRRVLVLGHAPVTALVPTEALRTAVGADLVLIAPSAADLEQAGWLAAAARAAHDALADDGIAYALLPRRGRGRVRAALRNAGLELDRELVQLGDPLRYLIPSAAGPWRYAFGSLIAARPLLRRSLHAASHLPLSRHWLGMLAPNAGILARRHGSAPPAAWVSRLGGEAPEAARVIVAGSWRRERGSSVLHCFSDTGALPSGVVKVTAGASAEADILAGMAESAGRAGARVPQLLAKGTLGDGAVIAETAVAGMPAAAVLGRDPGRVDAIIESVAGWLERWSAATAAHGGGVRRLEQELEDALDPIVDSLPDGRAYRSRLAAACARLEDRDIPLVARHNDLTMWNVLVDAKGSIGVIDWGEAEESGLPLTDIHYALVDATAATQGYRSRLEALKACPRETGERLAQAVGVGNEAARLCFHACWLRHARNEAATGTGDRSFLEIARWLARADV